MKRHTHPGSALLLLLITVAAVFLLCCKDRFATNLLVDVALKKELHEKKWWAAHGLLQYGVAYCAEKFFELRAHLERHAPMPLVMTCAAWPGGAGAFAGWGGSNFDNDSSYAQLTFVQQDSHVIGITAQLGQGQGAVQGSCVVRYDEQSHEKMVSAWQLL